MTKLLRANFSRCFNGNLFRILVVVTIAFSFFVGIKHYIDIQSCVNSYESVHESMEEMTTDHCVEEKIFNGTLFVFFDVAVFVGFFIGTEYSNGTMRNKITVGHGRTQIYLANLLVCTVVSIIFITIFIAIMLILGLLLMKDYCFILVTAKQFAILALFECLSFISATSIFVAIAMLIQSKAGGSIAILLVAIALFISALNISYQIRMAEYYVSYEYSESVDELTPTTERNPNYISGVKRKIYQSLDYSLPVNQLYGVSISCADSYKDVDKMSACSCALIILASGIGIFAFRKKDLK